MTIPSIGKVPKMEKQKEDEETEKEWESDNEITIILNVHMPVDGRQAMTMRSFLPDQFHPTNPIWLPSIKYIPPDPEKDIDPKPWRDAPMSLGDYFNYGFTEQVWNAYRFKQTELRQMFSDRERSGLRRRIIKKPL
jgi:hypothetical protein